MARDLTIEEQLLRYIAKDYSKNGDTMEAHLDAKGEYLMGLSEARNSYRVGLTRRVFCVRASVYGNYVRKKQ